MKLLITQHSAHFSTCGQILPEHVSAIAAAGYQTIINNRPDGEGGPDQALSADIQQAAEDMGLHYCYIPVQAGHYPPSAIASMANALHSAPGPIFCFCRSGTRSTQLYQLALNH